MKEIGFQLHEKKRGLNIRDSDIGEFNIGEGVT